MSSLATLYTQIGLRINDPVTNSPATGDGDEVLAAQKLVWINQVLQDTALLTDCLQKTGTVAGGGTETNIIADLVSSGATFSRILSVTDRTNGRIYQPITRREYQAAHKSIVTNSASGEFVYSDFLKVNARLQVLPLPSGTLTVEFSELPATIVDASVDAAETLPGILNLYDSLIVSGVARLYFEASGDETRSQTAFSEYIDWVQRLAKEVGTNPEILPEMSSLYRFIGSKMKELKG